MVLCGKGQEQTSWDDRIVLSSEMWVMHLLKLTALYYHPFLYEDYTNKKTKSKKQKQPKAQNPKIQSKFLTC